MTDSPHKGWHARGYLPHFDSPEVIQAVTFRLNDALPQAFAEAGGNDPHERRRIERALDAGYGACHLRDPRIAELTERALLHFHGQRYHLLAWVIMPNHVHTLVEPKPSHSLGHIVHSWKRHTAREANRLLGRAGPFWQADYHDRFIRDEDHLQQAITYIHNNPVKAGLVVAATDWRWSSAWPTP